MANRFLKKMLSYHLSEKILCPHTSKTGTFFFFNGIGGGAGKKKSSSTAGGNVNWFNLLENNMDTSKNMFTLLDTTVL